MRAERLIKLDLDDAGVHTVGWDDAKEIQAALQQVASRVKDVPKSSSSRVSLETSCTLSLAEDSAAIPYERVEELYIHLSQALQIKPSATHYRRTTAELLADPAWCAAHQDRVEGMRAKLRTQRAAVSTQSSPASMDLASRILRDASVIHASGTSAMFDSMNRTKQGAMIFVLYKTGTYTYDELAKYLHVPLTMVKNRLRGHRQLLEAASHVANTKQTELSV